VKSTRSLRRKAMNSIVIRNVFTAALLLPGLVYSQISMPLGEGVQPAPTSNPADPRIGIMLPVTPEVPRATTVVSKTLQSEGLVEGSHPAIAGPNSVETLIAPFNLGIYAVTSNYVYSGPVSLVVEGTGTAAGSNRSDAFYVYQPFQGSVGWDLRINGSRHTSWIQPTPAYNPQHIYPFTIVAPNTRLTFGVGDVGLGDNTGQYVITIYAGNSVCHPLTIQQPDHGLISVVAPPQGCSNGKYAAGTVLNIRTDAESGYVFDGWTGATPQSGSSVSTLVMDGPKSISARVIPFGGSLPITNVVVLVHGWHGTPTAVADTCGISDGTQSAIPPYFPQPVHYQSGEPVPASVADFDNFPFKLKQLGYDVWIAHVESSLLGTPLIEANAACLGNQIQQIKIATRARTVTVLAHSMGGLVARAYIDKYAPVGDVSHLITFGSPHWGTSMTNAFCTLLTTRFQRELQAGVGISAEVGAECEFSSWAMPLWFNRQYKSDSSNVRYSYIAGTSTPPSGQLNVLRHITLLNKFPALRHLAETAGDFATVLSLLGVTGIALDQPNDGIITRDSAVGRGESGIWPFSTLSYLSPGAGRYVVNSSHTVVTPFLTAPSFFWDGSGDRSVGAYETEAFTCLKFLLGHPNGNCTAASSTSSWLARSTAGAQVPLQPQSIREIASVFSMTATQTITFPVDAGPDGALEVRLLYPGESFSLTLQAPTGLVYDAASVSANPSLGSWFTVSPTAESFGLQIASLLSPTAGVYTATIFAGYAPISPTAYALGIDLLSRRILSVTTDLPAYVQGATALITATLSDDGVPITGGQVTAEVTLPGRITDTLVLSETAGGAYVATYTVPSVAGFLTMRVFVSGQSAGMPFERVADAPLTILPSGVMLTGAYADTASDVDLDGMYDQVRVGIGLSATQPGPYLISADLTYPVSASLRAYVSATLSGANVVTLPFDVKHLVTVEYSGPFTLSNILIGPANVPALPVVNQKGAVFQTQAYDTRQFADCFVIDVITSTLGAIEVAPAPNCASGSKYSAGTPITVTGVPTAGLAFLGWGGTVSGSASPLLFVMDADEVISATFGIEPVATSTPTVTATPTPTPTETSTPTPTPTGTATPLPMLPRVMLPLVMR
jgi:pimeloyl-ACP methyl ester carboxylesterase